MRPLSAVHFKSAGKEAVTGNPIVTKLAAKLAEAVAAALADFGSAAPRVTLDSIGIMTQLDEDATPLRFESRIASLQACIAFDRSLVFAMCELALGGTGTEEPVAESGRPFSAMEKDLRKAVISSVAQGVGGVLSHILTAPFRLFEDAGEDGPDGQDAAKTQFGFRYLVNIFGYSGELRVSFCEEDLAQHIGAASKPPEDGRAAAAMRDLQRRISGAEAVFKIHLAPEMVRVGDIMTLKPGSLLKLSATMSTPVVVSSGGMDVFSATLIHANARLAVRLIGPAG